MRDSQTARSVSSCVYQTTHSIHRAPLIIGNQYMYVIYLQYDIIFCDNFTIWHYSMLFFTLKFIKKKLNSKLFATLKYYKTAVC